jgi:hypothetical protein
MNTLNTENLCKAIISIGKRRGKFCNRKKCSIAGHDRVNDGKGVCRQILNVGRNRGEECGRKNCMLHPNIADFLELPHRFREAILHYKFVKELIKNYKKCNEPYKNEELPLCSSIIKIILNTIEEYPNGTRMLLAIYMIKLLDTPKMVSFRLMNDRRFNNVVYAKIEEFSNESDYSFSSYIKRQFESNKRYLHKSKNRIVLLRNYVLARRCFISLYNSKKHIAIANEENVVVNYCNIL